MEAKRRQKADAAELERLRKETKRLAEENEILQKASAFFASRELLSNLVSRQSSCGGLIPV